MLYGNISRSTVATNNAHKTIPENLLWESAKYNEFYSPTLGVCFPVMVGFLFRMWMLGIDSPIQIIEMKKTIQSQENYKD